MKIPLKLNQNGMSKGSFGQLSKATEANVLEHNILAARKGDWQAKNNLIRTFTPLITSLAKKRSNNTSETNKYIEAGKNGLIAAAKKYKQNIGPDKFQVFALDFIEAGMDRMEKGSGLLSRLFGK